VVPQSARPAVPVVSMALVEPSTLPGAEERWGEGPIVAADAPRQVAARSVPQPPVSKSSGGIFGGLVGAITSAALSLLPERRPMSTLTGAAEESELGGTCDTSSGLALDGSSSVASAASPIDPVQMEVINGVFPSVPPGGMVSIGGIRMELPQCKWRICVTCGVIFKSTHSAHGGEAPSMTIKDACVAMWWATQRHVRLHSEQHPELPVLNSVIARLSDPSVGPIRGEKRLQQLIRQLHSTSSGLWDSIVGAATAQTTQGTGGSTGAAGPPDPQAVAPCL
jgi:hypothetical protein